MTKGSHPTRAPDVAATLAWTSSRNPFGVAGAQTVHSSKPGPIADGASGHGGLSPWVVRNTLVLWGSDFKSRTRVEAPASLADLMPTVLKVLAIETERCDSGCGRVLEEALRASPDRRLRPAQRTVTTTSGAYRAALRLSSIGGTTTSTRERGEGDERSQPCLEPPLRRPVKHPDPRALEHMP